MQTQTQRIKSVEYIRGLAMLGVVGIHTGAYSLLNPSVNIHLFALFDIVTRFCVPIFFFVSAFGLFKHHDLSQPLHYVNFMKRRVKTVLFPYLTWSIIYMMYTSCQGTTPATWTLNIISDYLAFGLACYQLYFLVILLWFYALMPLWRHLVRIILRRPIFWLSWILVLQIAFNYYSSYILEANFTNPVFNKWIYYRMSYWVAHYVFIFLTGAICAIKYTEVLQFLNDQKKLVTWFFLTTLTGMLALYYYLIFFVGYDPDSAVNTAHQLSPIGVFYTLAASLYLLMTFSQPLNQKFESILKELGNHSYLIYLIHPIFMYLLIDSITINHIQMTDFVVIMFYCSTILLSLAASHVVKKVGTITPGVSLALSGSKQAKIKTGVSS